MNTRRAFTIVELMIVVAIIMLLVALVLGALAGSRAGAQRAKTAGALRQITAAYNAYAVDHNGHLMPGYMDKATVQTLQLTTRLDNGSKLIDTNDLPGASNTCVRSSYVYRLLPYMDYKWRVLTMDYASPKLDGLVETEIASGILGKTSTGFSAANNVGLAERPSFGLNSLMVGGDDVHGGAAADLNPWGSANPLAATRLAKAKQPARLIVFCPSKSHEYDHTTLTPPASPVPEVKLGYVEVRPPYASFNAATQQWETQQWQLSTVDKTQAMIMDGVTPDPWSQGGGLPVARWGDVVPVGMLDGSVDSFSVAELMVDMSRWSPFETRTP